MNPNKQDHFEDALALGVVLLPVILFIALIIWGVTTQPKGNHETSHTDHSEIIKQESLDDRYERHLQEQSDEAEADRMAPDWY